MYLPFHTFRGENNEKLKIKYCTRREQNYTKKLFFFMDFTFMI